MINLTNTLLPTPPLPRSLRAILLAGGDGMRVRDLTVSIVGDCHPKRLRPIAGTDSLLSQTRVRLDPVSSRDRRLFVDHHHSDDESLRSILRSETSNAKRFRESLVIVGAQAAYAETEYGRIEPGSALLETQSTPLCRVNRFQQEKPTLPEEVPDIPQQHAKRLLVLRDSGSGWAVAGSADRISGLIGKNANQPVWYRRTNRFSAQ